MIQPFIAERTRSKIQFNSSNDPASIEPIVKLIPTEHREEWLGSGSIPPPYYDPVIYWKAEDIHQKQIDEHREKLSKEFNPIKVISQGKQNGSTRDPVRQMNEMSQTKFQAN